MAIAPPRSCPVTVIGAVSCPRLRKFLLVREKRSGAICTLRLTRPGVDAGQFHPGTVLLCAPVGGDDFSFAGAAPTAPTPMTPSL